MVKIRHLLSTALAATLLFQSAYAEISDPFDPTQTKADVNINIEDQNKSATQLIDEGEQLLRDKRPLDARSKFIAALNKDPKQYHAHINLAGYYMDSVGYYRLALKYIKRAEQLFLEKNGAPPYTEFKVKYEHATILRYLSQARLNLDDYKGALETLDYFSSVGYNADWYSSSRAWVLMKMGRVEDAIKVAQLGYLSLVGESEKGNLLNMLGILYSMIDQRQSAIEIFKTATKEELSLGDYGYPATPLNNLGEVYKEIFSDDLAESTWQKAISMPDGCQHVLPSLNLTILYLDQLAISKASSTIDQFESCVAQFPLRNGEEHRALVSLARGRIAYLSGQPEKSIKFYQDALSKQQWFGKIGTNQGDLEVATLLSLSQAESALAHHLSDRQSLSFLERYKLIYSLQISAWWHKRQALKIATLQLNDFEDLYPRHTDSLFQYSSLADLTALLPFKALNEKVASLMKKDNRKDAEKYYDLYLAQNLMSKGKYDQARQYLSKINSSLRAQFDDAIKLQVLLLQIKFFSETHPEYKKIANQIFTLNKAALRNNGLKLPVNSGPGFATISDQFDSSAFIIDTQSQLQYQISYQNFNNEHNLSLLSFGGSIGNIRVKSSSLLEAIEKLTEEVFSEEMRG